MIINNIDRDHGSWTRGVELGANGVAILWYSPRRRLSISIWIGWHKVIWSHNVRLSGSGAV
jgi:hypothetical protein